MGAPSNSKADISIKEELLDAMYDPVLPLPTPGKADVARYVALYPDRYGEGTESYGRARKDFTDLLQIYYLLGGHLRRYFTIEELAEARRHRGSSNRSAHSARPSAVEGSSDRAASSSDPVNLNRV